MELAWAAGLFEGEGWIGVMRWKDRAYLQMQLRMTDEDVVQRFADVVGGHVTGPYARPSNNRGSLPLWHWSKAGTKAQAVLDRLLPYLGGRRQAQAARALARVAESR